MLFVSISSVVCSYLTCTACVTKILKTHTVQEIFVYIENTLISVKYKLQVNVTETFLQCTGGISNNCLNNIFNVGNIVEENNDISNTN